MVWTDVLFGDVPRIFYGVFNPFFFTDFSKHGVPEDVWMGVDMFFSWERGFRLTSQFLKDAVDEVRVPVGFNAGCRMYERVEATKQKEAAKLSPYDFDVDIRPTPADWQFSPLGFAFQGQWLNLPTKKYLLTLRLLVEAGEPLERAELHQMLREAGYGLLEIEVTNHVGVLRRRLRTILGITNGWDPIFAIRDDVRKPAAWTVCVPA
ncbi:MAG: hypothetical protein KDB23_28375 [Planctomycetales bacterium]|nr:hypothetical protein [Planctomycetales bacterium]